MNQQVLAAVNQRLTSLTAMAAMGNDAFAEAALERVEHLRAQKACLQHLLERLAITGKGLTLRHRSGKRWTVILGDPSSPGASRHQTFDALGFASHHTFGSLEEALADAVEAGFTEEDHGALERISCTRKWAIGSEIIAINQAVNAGRLSFTEGHARIAELRAQLVELG